MKPIEQYIKKQKPTTLVQASIDSELTDKVWEILYEKDIKMKDLLTAMFQAYIDEQKTKKK